MAVESKHKEYVEYAPKWQRMRDTIAGSDAIHAAGRKYLPKIETQSLNDYADYNDRAVWLGATGRTIDSLHGLINRKPTLVVAPSSMSDMVIDADLSGHSIEDIASINSRELLSVGRICLVVDFPKVNDFIENETTAADFASANIRPILITYKAESVINWKSERVNGVTQITKLVLTELVDSAIDAYTTKEIVQIRVLRLIDGIYNVEIWHENPNKEHKDKFILVDAFKPICNGKLIKYIPALIATTDGINTECTEPLLSDLAVLNISHYRTSASLENGAFWTGLPTPVIAGYQKQSEDDVITLGSSSAICLNDPASKWGFLEFSGQGLGALEKLMDRKEQGMAALGARLLTAPKAGVESASALEIRTTGETSTLAETSRITSRALTICLIWMRDWSSITGDVSVKVNSDFVQTKLLQPEITALVAAYQSGAISYQTLFNNLQKGEIIDADTDIEVEQARIDSNVNAVPNPLAQTI